MAIATDSPDRLPQPTSCAILDINTPAAVADWLLDNQSRFEHTP
jgi:molybdopterin-guanine dinucleotide biosynthesis protein B